jgi:hypothetical protein
MPIRIKRLKCQVSVSSHESGGILQKPTQAHRPVLVYEVPPPIQEETSSTIEDRQDEEAGASSGRTPAGPDPNAVAARVFDLMRREFMLQRERGES